MKTFCKLTTQSPAASYVPLPRFLLQDEALRDISNDAKVLYALLLDRASISRQNGYVEPDGTIRLYFTLDQAQTKLHRSRQSATRIFRELEYSGLIVRRKQGLGKPALITLNYPADAKLITRRGSADPIDGADKLPDAGAAPQRRGFKRCCNFGATRCGVPRISAACAAPAPHSQSWNRPSSARKNYAAAKSAARAFSPAPAGQNTAPPAPGRFIASRRRNPPVNGGQGVDNSGSKSP